MTFDQTAAGLNRLSLFVQHRDKVAIATRAGGKQCGNCDRWMKSRECPREHNVAGMNRGPSAGELACDQFTMSDRAADLAKKLAAEADTFAIDNGLHLRPKS